MPTQNAFASNLSSGNLVGAGISLFPTIFKAFSSIGQKKEANSINPANPGYALNYGVIDNARQLQEKAGNYIAPGNAEAIQSIESAGTNAFNDGVQGASSSGDVLDLASKIAYGKTQQLNKLALANKVGGEDYFLKSLDANALAGQEYVKQNAYERDQYDQQLRRKAALTEASNQNAYSALDTGASVVNSVLNPNGLPSNSPNPFGGMTPEQIQMMAKMWAQKRA